MGDAEFLFVLLIWDSNTACSCQYTWTNEEGALRLESAPCSLPWGIVCSAVVENDTCLSTIGPLCCDSRDCRDQGVSVFKNFLQKQNRTISKGITTDFCT